MSERDERHRDNLRDVAPMTTYDAYDGVTLTTTWYHLNGTPCVAGWYTESGLCAAGAGPVTPCPDVPAWITHAISRMVEDGTTTPPAAR